MNHSIHSADRTTHLKIVVVALVAGIAVAAFGISARTSPDYSQTAQVVKAGKADHGDQLQRLDGPLRQAWNSPAIGGTRVAFGRPFCV